MDRLVGAVFRFRFATWLLVLAAAGFLWHWNRPVAFDQTIESFFPPGHPAIAAYQRAKLSFGGDDYIFLTYDDEQLWTVEGMARVRELATAVREQAIGVRRVDSLNQMPLPWRVDAAVQRLSRMPAAARMLALPLMLNDLANVELQVRSAADRPEEIAELRRRVCSSTLFRNVLVDPDGESTALVVQLEPADSADHTAAVRSLRELSDGFAQRHQLRHVAVVGPPVLLTDGFIRIENDNRTLGVVAMILMALTMLLTVRSPWWALLPLASGGLTWLITAAFLNYFDLRLTLSAGPIIAQTVVLCMPAASHFAMHFRESLGEGRSAGDAARHTIRRLAEPVAWCALTAAAGYFALFSSTVSPVFQFGATMAASNLVAGLLAFALAAGAMCPPRWLSWTGGSDPAPAAPHASQVGRMTAWVIDHPGRTLVLFLLPCVVVATGMYRLRFESNYVRIYRSSTRVAQDYRFVEDRLGGIGLVELIVPAPTDPDEIRSAWLGRLEALAGIVRESDRELVGEVLSLADVLLPAPEGGSEPGRGTSEAAADRVIQTKLSFLRAPAFSHFVNNFYDRSTGRTRLLIRIRESAEAEAKQRAFDQMVAAARQRFGPDTSLTGLSHVMTQVTRAIIGTQFQATGWSCAAILVMLLLALRSARLGLIALLPTLLAIGLVLGAMGWLGIRIDMSTALVASIAAGLSVDDTFHCLLRYKRELRGQFSVRDGLRRAYAGAGPGVILSSSAVSLGFLAMVFSEFVPTANFGWLIAVATLGGSLGNLVVLPACVAVLDQSARFDRSDKSDG